MSFFARTPKAPRVDGNQHVRRRKLPPSLRMRSIRGVAASLNEIDLNTGLASEFFIQRHIGVVVSGGVDVYDFVCPRGVGVGCEG